MNQTPIRTSLVLGSGGARGLAHIGVIKALEQSDRYGIGSITGSSIGALIGGLHAAGKLEAYTDWVLDLSRADIWQLLDFSFTGLGLFKGDRLMEKLEDLVGDTRIEDLDIPFTAVASDIERREEVWIDEGSLFEAIRASIAIPGFFTPVERDSRLLVDGGLLSPLPIAPVHSHDAQKTIVVSLNGLDDPSDSTPAGGRKDPVDPEPASGLNVLRGWYAEAREKLGFSPEDATNETVLEIVTKSLEAMQDRIARYQLAAHAPDLLIEIPVDSCAVLDFHRAREMIDLGHQKTRQAIEGSDRPG
ncbi:MAG: patatin-like phospholipase family protein [Gammaproteobacteria bacterium]|nr:patatin-like phospholipase family protein [Gammaproteobacteria bacterium]